MYFQCRNCGRTSTDIDQVLDGECECGCTHFRIESEKPLDIPPDLVQKEMIRRDLHRWLDLNIDSMDTETIGNIRVFFEAQKQ